MKELTLFIHLINKHPYYLHRHEKMCDPTDPKNNMKIRIANVLLQVRSEDGDHNFSLAKAVHEAGLVLEAMRKPTRNMLREGYLGCDEDCYTVALGAWKSMIECAITGESVEKDYWPAGDDKYIDSLLEERVH